MYVKRYPMSFKLPKYTWDKDRKLCEKCQHLDVSETGGIKEKKSMSMRCKVSNKKNLFGGTSCIDERTTGICGPKGKLFKRLESA